MFRMLCKSKLQNATVTKKDLKYSGSIGLDKAIMEACDLYANEAVQVLNVNNGNRFETYVIEERKGSGTIALYGPAARLGEIGDRIVVLSYALIKDEACGGLAMRLVNVDGNNRVTAA